MSYNLPLPYLSPKLSLVFVPLCETVGSDKVLPLQQTVQSHLQYVQIALHQNEFLDIDLASAIATALLALLAEYNRYASDQQALIVGAARYFIAEDDIEPDTSSILGFDDDTRVLNYVLDVIGRPDLKVTV